MKIIIIVFSLLIMQDSLAQDCRTKAESKSEPLTRFQDYHGPSNTKPGPAEFTKMKLHNGKIENWIRNLLTDRKSVV